MSRWMVSCRTLRGVGAERALLDGGVGPAGAVRGRRRRRLMERRAAGVLSERAATCVEINPRPGAPDILH